MEQKHNICDGGRVKVKGNFHTSKFVPASSKSVEITLGTNYSMGRHVEVV